MNHRTRKLMTMHKALYSRVDTEKESFYIISDIYDKKRKEHGDKEETRKKKLNLYLITTQNNVPRTNIKEKINNTLENKKRRLCVVTEMKQLIISTNAKKVILHDWVGKVIH